MKTLLQTTLLLAALALAPFHVTAANRTWDGGDLDLPGFWSARTNWNGNSNIVAGDALFFPGTAAVKTMNNNLSISNFAKLTFNDDAFILNGNSLRLTNGITANYVPTGPTRLNVGVTLGVSSAFEADDNSATLELNGPVNLLGFALTNQGAGTITWLAPFSSTAGGIVRKRETGTTLVRSTNANFLGTVDIGGGDFNVNGRMPAGAINVNNFGTLGGTGLVNAVTVNSGGTISPGGGRAVLNVTGGLTLRAGGIYEAEILGATAGLFDQLNVSSGAVNLTNATLNLIVNFIPVSPTAITIINNAGGAVLGTFAGLPQGAAVIVNDSIRAIISYTGGTGNDVVITVSPVQTLTWTGSANGLWSVGGNWVGGAAPQVGDSLVFPVVSVRKSATNDLPADTVFGMLRLDTNYSMLGARVGLRRGVQMFHPVGSTLALDLPLLLAADQTFTNHFQDMSFLGAIELNGFDLVFEDGGAGVDVTIVSFITGAGAVTMAGTGSITLQSSNSFDGVLTVQTGRMVIAHPQALGTSGQGTVVAAGTSFTLFSTIPADLTFQEPITSAGRWNIGSTNSTWAGAVTLQGAAPLIDVSSAGIPFTLTGPLTGTNGLTKIGPGTLVLDTSPTSLGGTTMVQAGTLQVDTTMINSVLVVSNGATLTGTGTVMQAVFLSGAVLSLVEGGDVNAFAIRDVLSMQGASVFRTTLSGPARGQYGEVTVLAGSAHLGAGTAILDVVLGYVPAVGDVFLILNQQGLDVTGFFAGWPEGATNVVNGRALRITYTGGNGNDVVLHVVPSTRTWTGLGANNLWSTPQNWAGNFAPAPGDRLIFPATAARRTNVNDFAASTPFTSLSVTGSYTLSGAEIGLQAGLSANSTNSLGIRLDLPLTLLADQTFALSSGTSVLNFNGNIQLGSHILTLVATNTLAPTPRVFGVISGAGALRKTGSGIVQLAAINTYAGTTLIDEGTLTLATGGTLGSSGSATVVTNAASLVYTSDGAHSATEPLTLSGTLQLNGSGTVHWAAPIAVLGSTEFQLASLASLREFNFPQPISGAGNLNLKGISILSNAVRLHAANPFTGSVSSEGLLLEVNGSLPNASLTLRTNTTGPTTLTGTGLVRALVVGPGNTLSPAGEAGGDGTASTLTVTQSLTLQGDARLRVHLNGINAADYDQVDVLGTVNLGAGTAILDVQLGFTPPEGHAFAILDNDGVDAITGTFAGKPQGAIFTVGGQRLRISYTGGISNDITLTVLGPEQLTWTGSGGTGFWSTPGNWSPVRPPQNGDRLLFPSITFALRMTNDLAGLALHSLRFSDPETNSVSSFLHGIGFSVSSGLSATTPVRAYFRVPVNLTAAQTLTAQGVTSFFTRAALEFEEPVTLGADVTTTGSGRIRMELLSGPGRVRGNVANLELLGTNSHAGGLAMSGGVVNYAAQQTAGGPAFVTNATFNAYSAGQFSVSGLTLADSGLDLARPFGQSANSVLRVNGDLDFHGASRFIFGPDAGSQYVVEVTDAVRLNNAVLVVSNYYAAYGVTFTMIRNQGGNPVVGTFAGVPEDGVVTDGAGEQYRVSYKGGDSGGDVTITLLSPATGVTRVWRGGGVNGLWSDPANWRGGLIPARGDNVTFPDAPQPVNTNNLADLQVNQLRFTGSSGVDRVLTLHDGASDVIQLLGGLDYQDTGTLRLGSTNGGGFGFSGNVRILAPQEFQVASGGRVTMGRLFGVVGGSVTKTGGGTLDLTTPDGTGITDVPLFLREGTLRVFSSHDEIVQTGGRLEILGGASGVTLFGGELITPAHPTQGLDVSIFHVEASGATNPVVIRPGGDGAAGLIIAPNGITLNSNVTVRVDVAETLGLPGLLRATNDLFYIGDTGDFGIHGARLELNFLPTFQPDPTNLLLISLSQSARTNIGTFAGLPHLSLLTNEFGIFRLHYRDFVLPPALERFGQTNSGSVVLERTHARPVMVTVANGPGLFQTVTGLGTPGALYVIEASEDLVNWTALSGETANPATGVFTFIDATGLPYRFYRARVP